MTSERLWPPGVLRLTWQGLRRAWPALLAAWLLLTVINVAAYYLRRPVEPTWGFFFGSYLVRTIGQIAVTAVVTSWLVASMIRKVQPAALNGAAPWRLIPRGWAASFLSNLLSQAPAMVGMAVLVRILNTGNFSLIAVINLIGSVVSLAAIVLLGFALGEALTRRIGPVRALMASIRLSRGNRIALTVVVFLLAVLGAVVSWGIYQLMPYDGITNGQVLWINAAQCLFGVLSVVLLTGVYLELRRIQRAGEPEGISETFD